MLYSNDPVFFGQGMGGGSSVVPTRPRQQPRPVAAPVAVKPRIEPTKPQPQYVNVVIPSPDALGISLEPKPAPVVVPSPDDLGISLD